MVDSVISQPRHHEVGRELKRWVPDEDVPQCPELENIFDGPWNRYFYISHIPNKKGLHEEYYIFYWTTLGGNFFSTRQTFLRNVPKDIGIKSGYEL